MRVDAILSQKGNRVETVAPQSSLMTAVHKLAALQIGTLVVSRDGERVEGMLSERDVVLALERHGARVTDLSVAEAMSRSFPVCVPDDSVTELMAVMTRSRNRHLPVVSGGKLCGLVSIGDVVKSRLDEMELETRVLRDAYLGSR